MVDLKRTTDDPREQFWDEVRSVSACMLGLEGIDQHLQPMAPHADPDTDTVWFYSKKGTDLVKALGAGRRAHMVLVGSNHDYHACASGTLVQSYDPAVIDRYWSTVAAAWFDGGKSDPDLIMLQFTLKDAAVWASHGNPIVFGWEIAKANISGGEPDVGVRTHIDFV